MPNSHLYRFPAARSAPVGEPAAQEGGEGAVQCGDSPALLEYGVLDDMRWCADCGGMQRFIPLERWPGGWRGLCWGCEREKYVLFTRAGSEAA